MRQTETYKLNLIETSDTFSPQPINENVQTIEAALSAVAAEGVKLAAGSYTGTNTYGSGTKKL